MDTDLVSTPVMSASAADTAPALGDPADVTQGDSTIAVSGSDLDVSSVVQGSVGLESGEGGDGDGSGTPGPSGFSMDSDETTTTTMTSSEESLSDNDNHKQETSREQQLNKADLEHLADMGAPGRAVATAAIEAAQQEAAALVHQYKDISDPEDDKGVEEQSVKKKVPVHVSVPAVRTKVMPIKGRGCGQHCWGHGKISPSTGAEHVEVGARGSTAPKVKHHRDRQLYQETNADLMPYEGKSLQDHFDWILHLLFIHNGYGKLGFIY